ncbi:MAG: hypothetical protein AB7K24_30325 [Gemmataceae bacterium]
MDEATRNLIEQIHAAPRQCVLAVTGGGASACAALLAVPGGSRTVLEAIVPYDEQALVEFLGHAPDGFCSAGTARALAARAWARAGWLAPDRDVVGVGATASLVSDRPKKGDHRFHVACRRSDQIRSAALTLTKGARTRVEEERVLEVVILNSLAEALAVKARLPVPLLEGEKLEAAETALADPLGQLLRGAIDKLCVTADGRFLLAAPLPAAFVPGSFNPVHAAHWRLAEVIARRLGSPVAFELTVQNADKPPLAREDVLQRLARFGWQAEVWLTRAPTFPEKAGLFPGATFGVGADTAERIVQPRFYDDSAAKMTEALAFFRQQGCRFLVAGRADDHGNFRTLADLALPAEFSDLFVAIPESEFRINLSSTELRQHAAKE